MDEITQQLFAALDGKHTALAKSLIDDMTPEQLAQTNKRGATPLYPAYENSFSSKEDYRNLMTIVYKMRPQDLSTKVKGSELNLPQYAASHDDLVLNSVIAQLLPAKDRAQKDKMGGSLFAHAAHGEQYELAEHYLDKMPGSMVEAEASTLLFCLAAPDSGETYKRILTELLAPKLPEIHKAAKAGDIDKLVELHQQALDLCTEEHAEKIMESAEVSQNILQARARLTDKILSLIPEQEIPTVLISRIGGMSLAGNMYSAGLTGELKKHLDILPIPHLTGKGSLLESMVMNMHKPGTADMAEKILARIPDGDEQFNSYDMYGESLLFKLCETELPADAAERAKLFSFTADFISKVPQCELGGNEQGFTPLHAALRYGLHHCQNIANEGKTFGKDDIANLPTIVALLKRMDAEQLRHLRHAFTMLKNEPEFLSVLLPALKPELSKTDLLKLPQEIFAVVDRVSGRRPAGLN